MQSHVSPVPVLQHPFAELDRLGDEIAELSAHLDAATARLLSMIREFDARGGWNTGFRSCAAWLSMASPPGPTLHPGVRASVRRPGRAFSRRGMIFDSGPLESTPAGECGPLDMHL
jgi:hypothetical protein